MPELCYPCVCCHKPAEDEYHWLHEDKHGRHEIVWYLCEDCCEFAIEVTECVANLEEELASWISQQT
jgi:hypothetical protein